VLDLCTGSGAIGVSIAKMCPKIKMVCSDISSEALKIAEENAQASGCKSVKFQEGDLFSPFCGKLRKRKFDLIITNPPYIQTDVIPTLQREVKDHEPMSALDGGKDGLDFYRRIAAEAPFHLNKNGVLMMEIGYDQRISVTELLQQTAKFSDIICLQDLAGKDRIIAAKLIGK
jgi:release factor glutamine methyltransferase